MKLLWKMITAATVVTIVLVAGTMIYVEYFRRRRLIISTTTSLYETGLLDEIERTFESKYPIDLQFVAVGTGVAIEQAKNGDVDGTLVHSPSQEKTFLQNGYGVSRKIIAYNFFTIVGPSSDPAGINQLNATEALKKIAEYGRNQTGRVWVSRGDNSGTHTKEQSLWKSAGFNYTLISAESWYASAGSGMGETLLKAEEFSAYTLSDIGTYLKYYEKNHLIALVSFIAERQELLNVYSVIAVNQTLHSHANFDDTMTFMKYLVSDECQQLIDTFGKDDYGQSGRIFHGATNLIAQNSTLQIAKWIRSYAFFKVGNESYECPPQYRDQRHPELYGQRVSYMRGDSLERDN